MTRRATPGGGANAPRLPAESAAACGELRDGGDHRQHGLDAFADEQRRAVGGMAESHGEAVDAAERLARRRDARLGGPARIEPGALYAEDGVVVAGDGGDQRRKPADAIAVAVAKLRVEAQCREAAARKRCGVPTFLSIR